ncbi:MAG: hypothetical protein K2J94_02770, partial [Duncaniella sp.]|nr:hypothetical protein [Duncaniella sp.]
MALLHKLFILKKALMNFNNVVKSSDYRKKQDDKLKKIANDFYSSIRENRNIDATELLNYIQEYPNDYNREFQFLYRTCVIMSLNILQLAVIANDVTICNDLLNKGANPIPLNVYHACRNGYDEILGLLLRKYKELSEKDIALCKQAAILNGHSNSAYLIDLLLNKLYLQFSRSDTDYFIRALSFSIRNTVGVAYSHNPEIHRSLNEIMKDMLHDFNEYGYINYNLENLYTLKESVHNYIAFSKLFHLDAEDKITTAINYYNP